MDSALSVIPLPEKVERLPGVFRLDAETAIDADHETAAVLFGPATGFPFPRRAAPTNVIRLRTGPGTESLGPEGYRLRVTPEAVTLEASAPAGLFYAFQSLRQMLPTAVEAREPIAGMEWSLPCVEITDRPRFAWRGFMLDEGRHFHGRQTVLEILDLMALLKLNVFHWHLTDDQGWRIEIKKYPRLTTIGAQRPGTKQSMFARRHDGVPHGGFYTQEEIREIVAYAAARHITIVPEIDLPGHSTAALAAYPELSCTGGPFAVATGFGIFPDILCAGKESTLAFLEDILTEILDLFPSPFIHIGGDEAPKTRWKKCADCQARIRGEGLADEHALQVWLTNRIAAFLAERGRRIVGWNQILGEDLHPDAVVQYWAGNYQDLLTAIRRDRRPVIMSTYLDTYLDHAYSLMPLARAYRYEPIPVGLEADAAACILGPEYPLWSEWVPNRPRLDYQIWPRLAALAEVGWTRPERKDYRGFLRRLEPFLARLDRHGAPRRDWDPPFWKRLFGMFTIALPQRKIAS